MAPESTNFLLPALPKLGNSTQRIELYSCDADCACYMQASQTKGLLFYIRGAAHLERLAVAAWSLRQHYSGEVAVLVEGTTFAIVELLGRCLDLQVMRLPETGHPAYAAKVACLKHTPFDLTMFLDCDVVVQANVEPYLAMLDGQDFVFTHFPYEWSKPQLDQRLRAWKQLDITEPTLVDAAFQSPPINLGSFAYRKDAAFLPQWEDLATRAGNAGAHIPDEVCAQVYLSQLKFHLAGTEWGVCPGSAGVSDGQKILHFLGHSHVGDHPSVKIYQKALAEAIEAMPDLFEECFTPPQRLAAQPRFLRKPLPPATKPDLIYTIAFDPLGGRLHRAMAKMLISSLRRTCFAGEILVFRNSELSLFPSGRPNVREIFIPAESLDKDLGSYAFQFKFLAADFIDAEKYDRIMFIDADCLAVDNVTPMLRKVGGIQYADEYGYTLNSGQFRGHLQDIPVSVLDSRIGSNSGVWCVPADHYQKIMREWQNIYDRPRQDGAFYGDQPAWNRLLLDAELPCKPWSEAELMYPFTHHPNPTQWADAKLLHFFGGSPAVKVEGMFTAYMKCFYADAAPLILDILEF